VFVGVGGTVLVVVGGTVGMVLALQVVIVSATMNTNITLWMRIMDEWRKV
jgi:hypothetical protein